MEIDLQSAQLHDLWSMHAQIHAELVARLEAQIQTIERRLFILSLKRNDRVSAAPPL